MHMIESFKKLSMAVTGLALILGASSARATEIECQDPVLKPALSRLLKRDQELTSRQSRLIGKARALPGTPEWGERLANHENYLLQRASNASGLAITESQRAKLEAVIQAHRQDEIIERIHSRTLSFKREIASSSVRHARYRKELKGGETPLPDRILDMLGSYQAEQSELQRWISSFHQSCRQVTQLKASASARGHS